MFTILIILCLIYVCHTSSFIDNSCNCLSCSCNCLQINSTFSIRVYSPKCQITLNSTNQKSVQVLLAINSTSQKFYWTEFLFDLYEQYNTTSDPKYASIIGMQRNPFANYYKHLTVILLESSIAIAERLVRTNTSWSSLNISDAIAYNVENVLVTPPSNLHMDWAYQKLSVNQYIVHGNFIFQVLDNVFFIIHCYH